MKIFLRHTCLGLFWFTGALSLLAEFKVVKEADVPSRIRPEIRFFSSDWLQRIPAEGSVNAPDFPASLFPGQKIVLAVIAEGPERDKLLSEVTIQVKLATSKSTLAELHGLKPVAVRQIKAQGGDMAVLMLKAVDISKKDQAALAKSLSLTSYAIFQTDLKIPGVEQVEDLQITGTIFSGGTEISAKPFTISILPASEWLKETPQTKEDLAKEASRYRDDMSPGYLLARFRAAAKNGSLKVNAISSFFALAYRENAEARQAAVELFPSLDEGTQNALLYILQLAAQDVAALLPTVTPARLEALKSVEPLADPRKLSLFKDPVKPEEVQGVGVVMDQCWAGWMATGDPSYLKPLVGLLDGAKDYPAFQSWVKARSGAKGVNAKVGRGMAYQIAGWSIGSFQRTDPHVADWLLRWEDDSTFSPVVRKELKNLIGNPAFRRN